MEKQLIKVRNTYISERIRKDYKYIVVRECVSNQGVLEYWYYTYTNSLYEASMIMREIGNGIVLEVAEVTGEINPEICGF